jgi:hypothetical protein
MSRLSKIGAAALGAFGWTGGAAAVSASYLVVAGGGGGGGQYYSGGGGGGGLQTGTTSLNLTLSYSVIVGAGGSGGVGIGSSSQNGSNSVFGTLSASIGGGGGGGGWTTPTAAGNGGSGGGGAQTGSGGTGTSGQGYAGGNGSGSGGSGGGGGGAGAVGAAGSGINGGNGGVGVASTISGTSTYYAGGGGGGPANVGGPDGTPGTGGNGGGGNGGTGNSSSGNPGGNGTANTGGGGGGDMASSIGGGRGGSGVVIISYLGAQQFGGGVVTSVGGYTIHTFTTSGTLSPLSILSASYLIVAGGAGGGGGIYHGGGGGAGGMLTGSGVTIDTNSTYLVTVGAGGAGGVSYAKGVNGSNSSISIVATASVGGGGGGVSNAGSNGIAPSSGGSGGGAYGVSSGSATIPVAGGAGTSGQGNAGGTTAYYVFNSQYGASGGGGAGAVGGSESSGGVPGAGGAGAVSSISGTATYYAGGGGGSVYTAIAGGSPGAGGVGGGGTGGSDVANPTSGTANTGGGGGGAERYSTATGGSGGSGIVIISYAGSTQLMAGGTVTIVGGNVIHTFTSSGYLSPLTYVGNSLRFRASNSAYLSRTPTVAGSLTTWTMSFWMKRGKIADSNSPAIFSNFTSSPYTNEYAALFLQADDNLEFYFRNSSLSVVGYLETTQVLRDPAAWYHIVAVADTTNATSSDRLRLYVNGVRITAFNSATYPSQNTSLGWNLARAAFLARQDAGYFDGYLAETRFIDGQALTPNAFGTFNQYGVWQPVYYGGSYGTNGFYLPFNTNSSAYAGTFNGSSYITTGSSSGLALGTGDFTVEFFANLSSYPSIGGFVDISTSNSAGRFVIDIFTAGKVTVETYAVTLVTGSTQLPLNQWNHIAVVRSGTTMSIFQNGVNIGTVTNSTNFTFTSGTIGINVGPSGAITGAMSNLRIVKGTAVYNPSSATITVPTSSLTAISGTSLLTLQNSTIVDNSGNSVTLTNTGVTTGQTYPFATAIFNDQGPAGNNWTPNNISGVTGSTLDYMTDVPTLTSTTAANYAVLNPLATGVTLSDGNLSLTNGNTNKSSYSTIGVSSGKWYFEAVYSAGTSTTCPGVALQGYADPTTYIGGTLYSYSYDRTATKYNNGTGVSYGATYANGDVIGVALDLDAGTLTFYKNGTSQGVAYSSLPSGTYFLGASSYGCTGAVNYGQQPFTYTPPSGFVALNTYNL